MAASTTTSTAFAHATKLIAGRDKTTAQVRGALEAKGFPAAEIDEALRRCTELRYLDDARVAKRLALDGLDDFYVGEVLQARLAAKGVPEGVARAAIDEARAERGVEEAALAARAVARRKLRGVKAARFLASRGFGEDVVEQFAPEE